MTRLKLCMIKYCQQRSYGLAACLIILFSIGFRTTLIAFNYPEVNSDEGTMGIEAMHIAFQGQHPIYLYGQDYMGVLEAYLAAPFFRLFGVSSFTLRLGMLILFALFMLSMYWLARLLYSKRLALATLIAFSLGTSDMLIQQLRAVGGAMETVLFGSFMLVLAYLLAVSAGEHSRRRFFLYIAWGFTVGISLWVHLLVVPFVLSSGLLILVFCYREWRSAAIPCLLLGLLIGGSLLIPGYQAFGNALTMQGGKAALSHASPADLAYLPQKQFVSTFLWGIPLATWLQPVCTYQDLPYYSSGSPATVPCSLLHGAWSAGYLLLLGTGLCLAGWACWTLWRGKRQADFSSERQKELVLHSARLLLLLTDLVIILLYLCSPLSGLKPVSTRYLVGMLVATPGLLWSLRAYADLGKKWCSQRRQVNWLWRSTLVIVALTIVAGTASTITTVPAAYNHTQQQQKLVNDLLALKVNRLYLEYWTCYRLLFQSQERILCARPPYPTVIGSDRYPPDARAVQPDPGVINDKVPFMFPADSAEEIAEFEQYNREHGKHFLKYALDGMVLYLPLFDG